MKQLKAIYNKPNPPWADKAVEANRTRIVRAFGKKSLPELATPTDKTKYVEYGCGHYGCVYPTQEMGKVLKITSDPTEVALVKYILKNGSAKEYLSGLVRYYKILNLNTRYRKRDVYAILREEAFDVGAMTEDKLYREQSRKISAFLWFARHVRDMYVKHGSKPGFNNKVDLSYTRWRDTVEYNNNNLIIGGSEFRYIDMYSLRNSWKIPSWIKSSDRAGFALVGALAAAEDIAQTPEITDIGETLMWFLCKGKLLADVHLNNIGKVIREENYREPMFVITDPGHAVDVVSLYSYICEE